MSLLEAIKTRDAIETVLRLDELARELGLSSVIDFLVALPELDADFVRPLCVIREVEPRRAFYEQPIVIAKPDTQLGFAVPSGFSWSENVGRWVDPAGKPWEVAL